MRLDIDDVGVLTAVTQYHMPVALGTDSHDAEELVNMELGVIQAQRGWADPDHVIILGALKRSRSGCVVDISNELFHNYLNSINFFGCYK